jgi:hypothetical protein
MGIVWVFRQAQMKFALKMVVNTRVTLRSVQPAAEAQRTDAKVWCAIPVPEKKKWQLLFVVQWKRLHFIRSDDGVLPLAYDGTA